ncbi:helix-turn-helix transcriptional regulator [Mesorhizobium sp. M0047]|uniref:helix-turn-helix domain-containing protein n=1 Tax=Mesorhizobium sp. M0047 TaxID=2956859 RepID=UPI003336F441
MKIQGVQSKMARAALGLKIRELADLADVAATTITRLESGIQIGSRTLDAIEKAFENAGIKFTFEKNGDLGVVLSAFLITFEG